MRIARARGVAAAWLALASSSAIAGPSTPISATLTPVGPAARAIVSVAEDGTVEQPPSVRTGGDLSSDPPPRANETTADKVRQVDDDSVEPHRSLHALVRTFAQSSVADVQRECLAIAVYFEARGEPLEGQLAVAEVVLNRAASGKYPRTICGVVKQPWQFSFVRDGRFPPAERAGEAWRKAVAIAHIAAENLADELGSDVLWYHADYVAPGWARRLDPVAQIGAHVFYRAA